MKSTTESKIMSDPVIEKCKERNEVDFLYELTKIAAQSDSIGEGWSYCSEYNRKDFDAELERIENNINDWPKTKDIYPGLDLKFMKPI